VLLRGLGGELFGGETLQMFIGHSGRNSRCYLCQQKRQPMEIPISQNRKTESAKCRLI
jgi:hypothetical protein